MSRNTLAVGLSLAAHLAFGQLRTSVDGVGHFEFSEPAGGGEISSRFCVMGGCTPQGSAVAISVSAGPPVGGSRIAVKFRYAGTKPSNDSTPNFIVVFPASGTTSVDPLNPAGVLIGLNQSVVRSMPAGRYRVMVNFSTVDESLPSQTGVDVFLTLSAPPPASLTSVVNAASLSPAISPGAIVSIFGKNFGPPVGSTTYDDTGLYPTTLADSTTSSMSVTFNGIAAPLLYVSPGQINTIVPYAVAGQKSADVVVKCYFQSTLPFTIPIQDTSPAIFTATQNGTGQGAVLNDGLSYNSVDNPVGKGSAVVLFATGAGTWTPSVPDGALSLFVSNSSCTLSGRPYCTKVSAPVSLTIGGKPAAILYAGAAPYQPLSVVQVNALVPADLDSGVQPVVLTIGQNDNSQQKVTIAVK